MQKRTKLALLILIGLLLLFVGVVIFIAPVLEQRRQRPPQPPALSKPVRPATAPNVPPTASAVSNGIIPIVAPSPEENQARLLENRARTIVERMGSGSSETGFLGYVDVVSDMTNTGAAAVLAERRELQQQHPVTGPRFGLSTRAVASHITEGKSGEAKLTVIVEAIQQQDAGNPARPDKAVAQRVHVTFVKQAQGGYLIDKVVWEDVEL